MFDTLKIEIDKYFDNHITSKRYYAIMLFFTEMELGISNVPNQWVNIRNLFFTDGLSALNAYTNIKCPASQLIDADTRDELYSMMKNMMNNFNNQDWLNNELYPTL